MKTRCDERRTSLLNNRPLKKGPVIYIMFREQRCEDNWSLIFAQDTANTINQPLSVVFYATPLTNNYSSHQWQFMITGLKEVDENLRKKNVSFSFFKDTKEENLQEFIQKKNPGAVVTDFSPLSEDILWQKKLSLKLEAPIYRVDAHNTVPCTIASPKQEFAAYTIRPKIKKLLPLFVVDLPKIKKENWPLPAKDIFNWKEALLLYKKKKMVEKCSFIPGSKAAQKTLRLFLENKINSYDKDRNDPVVDGQSNLSPYIHFGHISAQRVILETKKLKVSGQESFLEEIIVRKELSDNFCYYNKDYKNFNSFPNWAQETLNKHREDKRDYIYNLQQLEEGSTHDELWNAAQGQMTKSGKMHGYMRMYWAKKILEWSASPEEAMKSAIFLNDKYSIDGYDSRGYAGIAWCLGGVHDRAWGERPVFGKIRYMSYNGSRTKFKVKDYINKIKLL